MDVRPTAADSAIKNDSPRRTNLAQRDPSYNPATCGRATLSSNACRSGTPAGKDINLPDTWNRYLNSRG